MKAKRVLFLIYATAIIPAMIVFGIVMSVWQMAFAAICGLFEVVHILNFRFEMWSADYPKDQMMNCPWKHTLRIYYLETYRRVIKHS